LGALEEAAYKPASNMRCSQCAQVFSKHYQVGWAGFVHTHDFKALHGPAKEINHLPHYGSYTEFEKSAQNGCHICLLFWNQVPDNDRDELRKIGLHGYISIREPTSQIDSRNLFEIGLAYVRRAAEDGTRQVTYLLGLPMLEIQSSQDGRYFTANHDLFD
jgi:hypothetical protein